MMEAIINLIKDPKNKVIAILAVALITSFIFNMRSEAEEVKEEAKQVSQELKVIVEDDRKDEIDFTKATKDIETNQNQIKALWSSISKLEEEFRSHEDKRKH